MIKRLIIAIAAAATLSTSLMGTASAGPVHSNEMLARLAQKVPDGTAQIKGVPTTFTLVSETYFIQDGKCAVERTYVWSDEYGLFRHHTKAYWC